MGIISYAQNFEDVLLNRVFGSLNYGFYVDIGAHHPSEDSVTKAFYDRGWNGINIEPGDVFEVLAAARPRDVNLRLAVADRAGEVRFVQHPATESGLSHVLEEQNGAGHDGAGAAERQGVTVRQVACDTLTNILHVHARRRPIAFLKIDAEGSEHAIIRSTDWRSIRPTVLVIEATIPLSNQLDNQAWEPILLEHGYIRTYFDGINCFYVPEERPELLHHFVLPVNVLDGFTRPDPPALAACREELRLAHERLHDAARQSAEYARTLEQNGLYARLLQTQAETITELRQQAEERIARFDADRDALVAQFEQAEASLRRQHDESLAALSAGLTARLEEAMRRQAALAGDASRLDRLVHELRWPDGPGAVRAVLPLARLLRRLRGTQVPAPVGTEPRRTAVMGVTAVPPRRSRARRLALLVYAVIRPVARPIAWRWRTFLTGEILGELARQNQSLQIALNRTGQQGGTPLLGISGDSQAVHEELRQFGNMLETTLLTLALERDPQRRE